MGWTEERVDLLKKLWMEGLSASQIAAELGEGVTRNAVIGKVHRLKLSGRAKPATSSARPRNVNRAPRRSGGSSGGNTGAKRRLVTNVVGATALKPTEVEEHETLPNQQAELFIPPEERIGLLSLTEKTCKWPIGDPLMPEFHFCGRDSEETGPYCEFHSKRAYHQLDRRKR